LRHFSTKFQRKTHSNRGPTTRSGQGVAASRRRARPRAARDHLLADARSSPCAAPRGSSESSRGLARRATPYRAGARHGPPVRQRHPVVHAWAEVAVLRRHLRRHRDVTGEVSPIKKERLTPPGADTATSPRHPRYRRSTASSGHPRRNPRVQHIL
jgi:hypothetical protein